MNKFGFSRLVLLIGCIICSSCTETKTNSTYEKPNVLFIAIDDLNDWVGCLKGHPQVKTPYIDRLASMGTLFTNAHTQSPICNPSRTSVLTGYRPSTTGIYGLSPWIREVPELKGLVTIPQYFTKNGYKTYSAGKIFHGGYGRRGTDSEFDSLGPGSGVKKQPRTKLAEETPRGNNPWVDWGSFPLQENEIQDYDVATWAVDVLRNKPEAPYFLSVGFFLPHVPLYAPESFFDLYPKETLQMSPMLENDRKDTPKASWYNHWDVPEPRWKWFQEQNQDSVFVQSYLASISFMDKQVGRVLDALNESGQAENTIIVLWSDHGFHLGEKEISGKNTLWERSTRVPLIFAGKRIGRGKTVSAPVELLDIYPTLNELCNFPEKKDLEGHSLVPQLTNAKSKRNWPAITTNNYQNHAVRTENWRYIQYANGSEELYDMKNDPNEWHNLIGVDVHKKWTDSLKKWIPRESKPPFVGNYQRILENRTGKVFWQGKEILPQDSIPGFN
ncbi:sulfatase [Maribacter algarum]|uniref:Sulfatase n=1 Tax=Maribacter algarum (ex Zhang et al. 2020) TaxID=2578118 RepID=A0A5S3PPQ9_9FLAO|nr:sulfatase [Maribacter algarum]TMM56674.1 sulfatase [Maribacter algarum]